MDFLELVGLYDLVGSSFKRLEKVGFISEFLKSVKLEDVEGFILLLQGRVFPVWSEVNSGIASKTIIKAISSSVGLSQEEIIDLWKKEGDLGKVCIKVHSNKKQSSLVSKKLSVEKVLSNLRKVSEVSGEGSVSSKISLLSELISFASPEEAMYIVRIMLGDLQIGVGEGVIRESIVWCFFPRIKGINSEEDGLFVSCDEKLKNLIGSEIVSLSTYEESRKLYNSFMNVVQKAYDFTNDFTFIIKKIKTEGLDSLENVSLIPGRPFNVMLAVAAPIEDSLKSVKTPAQIEFKYDGFRAQIHKIKNNVTIFTRKLENVTHKFPDVVDAIKKLDVESIILDSEIVGYDKNSGVYLPFQKISQRINRKHSIDKLAKEFPVQINVFDVLYKDGEVIKDFLLEERLKILREVLTSNKIIKAFREATNPNVRELLSSENIIKNFREQRNSNTKEMIHIADSIITSDKKVIEDFFQEAMKAKAEGLMIKSLSSPYVSGRKVGTMFKYKEVMETLDLVIVGAEWGKGKRANWLSSFDIACKDGDEFLYVGKVATGLKEKSSEGFSFEELTNLLKPLIVEESEKHVRVVPKIVIEVGYEEIQKSPNYDSGFALRFPRFVRLRIDRKTEDVAEKSYIEKLFLSQSG